MNGEPSVLGLNETAARACKRASAVLLKSSLMGPALGPEIEGTSDPKIAPARKPAETRSEALRLLLAGGGKH